jgi:hypothetical protein
LSLSHDPAFAKSILRRAIAKFEIRRFDEAIADLRKLFKYDSKHPKALDLMRQMTGAETMPNFFRFAFARHRLRRAISCGHLNFDPSTHKKSCLAMLRVMVGLTNLYFKISF